MGRIEYSGYGRPVEGKPKERGMESGKWEAEQLGGDRHMEDRPGRANS